MHLLGKVLPPGEMECREKYKEKVVVDPYSRTFHNGTTVKSFLRQLFASDHSVDLHWKIYFCKHDTAMDNSRLIRQPAIYLGLR